MNQRMQRNGEEGVCRSIGGTIEIYGEPIISNFQGRRPKLIAPHIYMDGVKHMKKDDGSDAKSD